MENLQDLMILFAGFMLVFLVILFVLYILGSIGLAGITKNVNEKGAWMAWFPLFSFYLIGKLGFSKVVGWVMVVLSILGSSHSSTVGGKTVTVGTILPTQYASIASFALVILLIVSLFKIYSRVSERAVAMIICTVLSFGLLAPIFLFAIRKNEVIA